VVNFTLPWPPRCLHPNSRKHWGERGPAVKKARADAYLLTKAAMGSFALAFPEGVGVYVKLTFCPPNKRKHDIDGCLSANKAALDGIADALGVDDSRFSLTLERGAVVKGGAVHVTVYA
jgi:crossover junction endodeoxyribonuclease RusA